MRRVSSQLILCSPSKVLRNCVLEQDENGVLTQIIDLQTQQSETHHTLFYDGIITNGIVSLQDELSDIELNKVKSNYNYFGLSDLISLNLDSQKALLIDFGTSNIITINQLINTHNKLFVDFNIFEFLTACCFQPLQILNRLEFIELNHKPNLLIWKGLNLIDKQITPITKVENL